LALIYNSSSKQDLDKTTIQLKQLGSKFKIYKCDIKDLKVLKRTIDKIGKVFGKIDILINNAGTIKKIDFENISQDLFDSTISVNLRAPLFAVQYSLKYLNRSPDPQIINIASLGGLQNWSGFMPYSISKAGLIKLTYLLARRLAPKIRVNGIAPGSIVIEGEKAGTPGKIAVDKIPLKRYGTSKDIIEAVKFIINCNYLTGHVIPVDGGRLLS
jgi:NAD(P)-dependent dehydrogenase (short-subunit alcohol dehydrogenase family)